MALNRFGWLYWVWLVVLGLVGLSLREQLILLATCREGAASLLGLLKFVAEGAAYLAGDLSRGSSIPARSPEILDTKLATRHHSVGTSRRTWPRGEHSLLDPTEYSIP